MIDFALNCFQDSLMPKLQFSYYRPTIKIHMHIFLEAKRTNY